MVTQAERERKNRRQIVLSALKKCGTSPGEAHLSLIYEETQKEAIAQNTEISVGEQTIKGDLESLCRKKPLWDGDRGKVKKIKRKAAWQYLEPKPPSFAAYGYRWKRDSVNWKEKKLEGKKKEKNAEPNDFADEAGVYLLHNGDRTVYVGRVTSKQGLYGRLRDHTLSTDRKLYRDWDKFSWFVFKRVKDDGPGSESEYLPPLITNEEQLLQVITTIEAVIINGIQPSKNVRGGDVHHDVHYEQVDTSK